MNRYYSKVLTLSAITQLIFERCGQLRLNFSRNIYNFIKYIDVNYRPDVCTDINKIIL